MGGIIGYLAGPWGTIAIIVGGVLAFWTFFAINNVTQRQKGAEQQISKTEKANAVVLGRAHRVRTKSISPGVRGRPDPNYID